MPGSRVERRRRSPLVGGSLAASAVAVAGASHWLNRRARRLAVLDDRPGRQPADLPDDGYTLVTAAGVAVDDATQAAAARHARAHDLDVLDLVPGDLPSGVLQALLLQIDPARYRDDRLAVGRGAGHAAVVRTALLARVAAAHPPPGRRLARPRPRGRPRAGPPVEAVRAHGHRPGRRARPAGRARRRRLAARRISRALAGVAAPVLAPLPAVGAVLALLAPLVHPVAGGAALAAYLAQPALVARRYAGPPARPRGCAACCAGRSGPSPTAVRTADDRAARRRRRPRRTRPGPTSGRADAPTPRTPPAGRRSSSPGGTRAPGVVPATWPRRSPCPTSSRARPASSISTAAGPAPTCSRTRACRSRASTTTTATSTTAWRRSTPRRCSPWPGRRTGGGRACCAASPSPSGGSTWAPGTATSASWPRRCGPRPASTGSTSRPTSSRPNGGAGSSGGSTGCSPTSPTSSPAGMTW